VFDKIPCRLLSIFDIVKLITTFANQSPSVEMWNNLHALIALLEKHDYLSDWGYKYCVNDMCSICSLEDMDELWTNYIDLQQRVNDMLVNYKPFTYEFKTTIPQSQHDDLCYNVLMFREELGYTQITQPKLTFVEYLIQFYKFPMKLNSTQIELIIQGCKRGVGVEKGLEFVKKYTDESVNLFEWTTTTNETKETNKKSEMDNTSNELSMLLPATTTIKVDDIGKKFDKLIELMFELKKDLSSQ
jgi:hypothetical protein